MYSKGDLVKIIYTSGRDIDYSLPIQFIDRVVESTGLSYKAIIGHFVYNYQRDSHGVLCPLTTEGVEYLRVINRVMDLNIPLPEKVFNPWSSEVEGVDND